MRILIFSDAAGLEKSNLDIAFFYLQCMQEALDMCAQCAEGWFQYSYKITPIHP
jgi:hypothetical protein